MNASSPAVTARSAPVSSNPPAPAIPPVLVRVADVADAEALAACAARLFTTTYARGGHGPVAASRPEDVAAYVRGHFTAARQRAELADPALVTFVAEFVAEDAAGGWAGYAQLRLWPSADAPTPAACAGPAPRELARIYVDPAWQGRGVAPLLLDAVEARARAEPGGADPLWLAVYQANARAVGFYRRRGFAVAGAARFTMGDETQADWLMARRPPTSLRSAPPAPPRPA